jgi:hypothetical protein
MKTGTSLALLALLTSVCCTALWVVQVWFVDIPEDRTMYVVFFLIAAALGVGALVAGTRWLGRIAAAVSIVIGLLVPYTIAISPQQVAANAIQVGDTIPHFTALDEHGEVFDSESLHGHLVLIKFFRAHW